MPLGIEVNLLPLSWDILASSSFSRAKTHDWEWENRELNQPPLLHARAQLRLSHMEGVNFSLWPACWIYEWDVRDNYWLHIYSIYSLSQSPLCTYWLYLHALSSQKCQLLLYHSTSRPYPKMIASRWYMSFMLSHVILPFHESRTHGPPPPAARPAPTLPLEFITYFLLIYCAITKLNTDYTSICFNTTWCCYILLISINFDSHNVNIIELLYFAISRHIYLTSFCASQHAISFSPYQTAAYFYLSISAFLQICWYGDITIRVPT